MRPHCYSDLTEKKTRHITVFYSCTFIRGIPSLLHFSHTTGYAGHSFSWCSWIKLIIDIAMNTPQTALWQRIQCYLSLFSFQPSWKKYFVIMTYNIMYNLHLIKTTKSKRFYYRRLFKQMTIIKFCLSLLKRLLTPKKPTFLSRLPVRVFYNWPINIICLYVETPIWKFEKKKQQQKTWQTVNTWWVHLCILKMLMYISDSIFSSTLKRAKGVTPLTCSGWFALYRIYKFQVYTCILFPGVQED